MSSETDEAWAWRKAKMAAHRLLNKVADRKRFATDPGGAVTTDGLAVVDGPSASGSVSAIAEGGEPDCDGLGDEQGCLRTPYLTDSRCRVA